MRVRWGALGRHTLAEDSPLAWHAGRAGVADALHIQMHHAETRRVLWRVPRAAAARVRV